MSGLSSLCRAIETALQPSGIVIRGTVAFSQGEGPRLNDGSHAASVILLGNVGGSIWPAFSAWRRGRKDADPLDTWSKHIIRPLAARVGGTAYFPSDPPWQPFQQWAMRAEGLKPSPLGILVHPRYGLWHGYRGAIALGLPVGTSVPVRRHACDTCLEKPCLTACPVGAIAPDPTDFALSACRGHLATQEGGTGQGSCMEAGCLARNACPVGADYRYPSAQIEFHMRALMQA
jgi:hypothetical protein